MAQDPVRVRGTPQGTRVSMDKEKTCAEEVKMDEGIRDKVLRGVGVVGIGLAAFGIGLAAVAVACSDNSKEKGKTMKAPGRDYRIPRPDFESDPATYFRELRKSTRRSSQME